MRRHHQRRAAASRPASSAPTRECDDTDAAPDATLGPDPLDPSYPTKHTPIPLVNNLSSAIIQHPEDRPPSRSTATPARASLEQFGDIVTTTHWWEIVRDGYCDTNGACIQQGSSGGYVHLPDSSLKPSYTDSSQGAPPRSRT